MLSRIVLRVLSGSADRSTMSTSRRGVITARTGRSPNRITPAIIARSLGSITPAVSASAIRSLDFIVCDLVLGLPAVAEHAQHRAPGNVEEPDDWRSDRRERRHGGRYANCDSLRVAQRNLLRHKFADDQRNIGNCGDHQAHTGDFRDSRRHADGREPLRQPLSERGPRKRAREYAIQSDPDLDGREKFARFGRERQRPAGADHLAVDHGLQTSASRRHDRELGHSEDAVEQINATTITSSMNSIARIYRRAM